LTLPNLKYYVKPPFVLLFGAVGLDTLAPPEENTATLTMAETPD
jgi:hypothetical protein